MKAMLYGVKSKTYKRYIREFTDYSQARVFCLKQRQIWKNATMQIFEIIGLQADVLLEELSTLNSLLKTKPISAR